MTNYETRMRMIKKFKHSLNYLAIISLGILLLNLTACNHQPDAHDIQGRPINLADYHGKWVVINYWATWCHPCLQELPALNQFYQHYSDKAVVLGVSFDQLPANEIQQLAQRLALNFPLLSSFPMDKFGVENINALPITFLVAPDGHLQATLHGPQTQESLAKTIGVR
jgi:peroxiredoxin